MCGLKDFALMTKLKEILFFATATLLVVMPKMLAVQKLKKLCEKWCQLIETREPLIVIKGRKIERATAAARVQFFCKEKCKKGH